MVDVRYVIIELRRAPQLLDGRGLVAYAPYRPAQAERLHASCAASTALRRRVP